MQQRQQTSTGTSQQLGQTIKRMRASMETLRGSISMVRYAPGVQVDSDGTRAIDFYVDGAPWRGYLRGDNAELQLSGNQEANASLAMRLLIDRMARPNPGRSKGRLS